MLLLLMEHAQVALAPERPTGSYGHTHLRAPPLITQRPPWYSYIHKKAGSLKLLEHTYGTNVNTREHDVSFQEHRRRPKTAAFSI